MKQIINLAQSLGCSSSSQSCAPQTSFSSGGGGSDGGSGSNGGSSWSDGSIIPIYGDEQIKHGCGIDSSCPI